jgi:radical SAM protein with 4Fe4S-binding SPASM domain
VVAPNGSAGLCEYNAPEGRSYVPIEEFSAGAVPDLPQWTSRSPLNTRECLKCPALATCGGGCAYDSQVLMGDALKFDPWLCETNVEVMRWVLHDLLSQVQDRVRDEDFHLVTPQERALVLGSIALDGPSVPMPQVFDYGETAEARHCSAEGCGE